mmetsp:Transcript_58973/g.70330  ORF Transcript_58973/g.70330 Transcript_58973/m.70330 type:complete len:248 (+) Transcript_58973:686-1429(+)
MFQFLLIIFIRTLQSNNLTLDLVIRKHRTAEPRRRQTTPPLQISFVRRGIMTQHRFFAGRFLQHIHGYGVPILQKGHVGVDLHEPRLAIPELRSEVPRRVGTEGFGFLDVEGADASGVTVRFSFRGGAEDFVAVFVGFHVLHFTPFQYSATTFSFTILLHQTNIQFIRILTIRVSILNRRQTVLVTIRRQRHKNRIVVPPFRHSFQVFLIPRIKLRHGELVICLPYFLVRGGFYLRARLVEQMEKIG